MRKATTSLGIGSSSQRAVHDSQVALVTDSLLHETTRDMFGVRRSRGGITAETVATCVHTAVLAVLALPHDTDIMVADAGANAARSALARLEPPTRIGDARMGWRGRLAHIELMLSEGNHATALREIRGMIDGD